MNASNFFTKEHKEDIKMAIKMAELDTSGEIRVHIEIKKIDDPITRALEVFRLLKMDKTEQRNGVLIYLAIGAKKFAIIGDEGINNVVPENFWEDIKSNMLINFRESNFTQGITTSIKMVGDKLKEHFPFVKTDVNELSDEISFDDAEITKKSSETVEHNH